MSFFHYVTDVLDYNETIYMKPIHYYNTMYCEQDRFSLACLLLMKKKVNGLLHSSMGYGSTCQECIKLYEL